MNRLIGIISCLLFVSTVSAKAEVGIGIAGAMHKIKADGTETVRDGGPLNNKSIEEDTMVPEIFIEKILDDGKVVGLSYIPTREISGTRSRTDTATNTGDDAGTYSASADLENVFKFYADVPAGSVAGQAGYVHFGLQHVTVLTVESLNSGSSYPDADLFGATIGYGIKGDLPYGGLYYKGELTYTNFEDLKVTSAGNTVEADLEDIAARLAIGYKF